MADTSIKGVSPVHAATSAPYGREISYFAWKRAVASDQAKDSGALGAKIVRQ